MEGIAALNPVYEFLYSEKHLNNFAPISSDTKEVQTMQKKKSFYCW